MAVRKRGLSASSAERTKQPRPRRRQPAVIDSYLEEMLVLDGADYRASFGKPPLTGKLQMTPAGIQRRGPMEN